MSLSDVCAEVSLYGYYASSVYYCNKMCATFFLAKTFTKERLSDENDAFIDFVIYSL